MSLSPQDCLGRNCGSTFLQNPCLERECQEADKDEVWNCWYEAQNYIDAYRVATHSFCINVEVAIAGFNIDNRAAKKAISDAKAWHARN